MVVPTTASSPSSINSNTTMEETTTSKQRRLHHGLSTLKPATIFTCLFLLLINIVRIKYIQMQEDASIVAMDPSSSSSSISSLRSSISSSQHSNLTSTSNPIPPQSQSESQLHSQPHSNSTIPKIDYSKDYTTNPQCNPRVYTASSRRPWAKKQYTNRTSFPSCTFTPPHQGGPTPTIFIVNGRSGSDATWSTLTTLAGQRTPIGEHTGENKVKAMSFLSSMNEKEAEWWITEHLCEFTRRYCHAPIAGFKWKPFVDSWMLPSSQAMLRKLGTFDTPRIQVIFMTRNPLDVLISKVKHRGNGIKAHCHVDDVACLKKFQRKGKGLHLNTETLMQTLDDTFAGFDLFESQLKEYGVSHITITYEELYGRQDAEEWMRVFRFLGRGPQSSLTMDQVRDTFAYATTFAKHHNESLANYEEVLETLSGTKYEKLLH